MEKEEKFETRIYKDKVHIILAHSYSVYYVLLLVGVLFDVLFPVKIITFPIVKVIGLVLMVFASGIVYWAQRTSRNMKVEVVTKSTFMHGPYQFTRTPTHWALFFLMLGFGLITNAIFILVATLVSFVISKFFFLRREERLLAKKYGAPYLEYVKTVRI